MATWLPTIIVGPVTGAMAFSLNLIQQGVSKHRADERAEDIARQAAKDKVDEAFRKNVETFIAQQGQINRERDIEIARIEIALRLSKDPQ